MLPAGHFLPRPGRLRIDIVAVTQPEDPAFEDHRLLAEHTRQQILGALDEPDLL